MSEAPQPSAKHVLIIEDEADIREVAQLSLELSTGWQVSAAPSGAEGIERAVVEKPDAILLDVMMPGMDGPATLRALREREETRLIPIVFLTAKVQSTDREQLEALGVSGLLPKPFDPLELGRQVAALLGWPVQS